MLKSEILQIEADLIKKEVNLSIRFSLSPQGNGELLWTETLTQRVPVQSVTGESFARGVQYALNNIIKDLNTHINDTKIHVKKNKK